MVLLNNEWTLKVEKENAWGMIEGFKFENKRHFVTIFAAHKNAVSLKNSFRDRPKIISPIKKRKPEHITNNIITNRFTIENYHHQLKYMAVLEKKFHINSNLPLWEKICNNGLFNIWDPVAPLNNLKNKTDQMILLLRIFEIDCDFSKFIRYDSHYDIVPKVPLNIIRPIIPQNKEDHFAKDYTGAEYFDDIVKKLHKSIGESLRFVEPVQDSSELYNKSHPP